MSADYPVAHELFGEIRARWMATRPGVALTREDWANCASTSGAPPRSRPASPVTCGRIACVARSSLLQMTRSGRIPSNYRSGRYWARTSDLRLVETKRARQRRSAEALVSPVRKGDSPDPWFANRALENPVSRVRCARFVRSVAAGGVRHDRPGRAGQSSSCRPFSLSSAMTLAFVRWTSRSELSSSSVHARGRCWRPRR